MIFIYLRWVFTLYDILKLITFSISVSKAKSVLFASRKRNQTRWQHMAFGEVKNIVYVVIRYEYQLKQISVNIFRCDLEIFLFSAALMTLGVFFSFFFLFPFSILLIMFRFCSCHFFCDSLLSVPYCVGRKKNYFLCYISLQKLTHDVYFNPNSTPTLWKDKLNNNSCLLS